MSKATERVGFVAVLLAGISGPGNLWQTCSKSGDIEKQLEAHTSEVEAQLKAHSEEIDRTLKAQADLAGQNLRVDIYNGHDKMCGEIDASIAKLIEPKPGAPSGDARADYRRTRSAHLQHVAKEENVILDKVDALVDRIDEGGPVDYAKWRDDGRADLKAFAAECHRQLTALAGRAGGTYPTKDDPSRKPEFEEGDLRDTPHHSPREGGHGQ